MKGLRALVGCLFALTLTLGACGEAASDPEPKPRALMSGDQSPVAGQLSLGVALTWGQSGKLLRFERSQVR